MNWRAIGIGVAVNILVWFGVVALSTVLVHDSAERALSLWRWLGPTLSSIGDIAAGATAGWIAGRRGAAHGALAVALGSVATFIGGIVLAFVRMGGQMEYLAQPSYWISLLGFVLLGVVLGTIAGAAAVALRPRRP